jgi:hypothetical protein
MKSVKQVAGALGDADTDGEVAGAQARETDQTAPNAGEASGPSNAAAPSETGAAPSEASPSPTDTPPRSQRHKPSGDGPDQLRLGRLSWSKASVPVQDRVGEPPWRK